MRLRLPLFLYKLLHKDADLIRASKNMINSIQQLVGINDVFGDRKFALSLTSILCITIFFGAFVYVGAISQCVYLVHVFPNKLETFKTLNCLSATCVPTSKYIFMWTARNRLKCIFAMCREGMAKLPADSDVHRTLIRYQRKGQYLSWMVIVNQFTSHILYLLIPFLFTICGNKRYLPTTPGDILGLTPRYETPYYESTFIITVIATCFSAINQTGYIVLFVTILAHELGHFHIISETLNNLHDNISRKRVSGDANLENETLIKETISFCVEHHKFLMKYHEKVKNLYKTIFGAHFLMMTVVLITTLQTLNAWDVRNTILTGVTGILPLFVYCFGGEMLISAGKEMSNALYNCGWELMSPKQAKIVLLMLCISQRPLHLTAADVFTMNRETFGKVAQTVYKVYTVFN